MELRFAHLADFASADASGKLTVVGVFDIVLDKLKQRPIPFPLCHLVASFSASVAEGSHHQLEIQFADADEKPVNPAFRAPLTFRPFGPGYPLRAQVIVGFGPGALRVQELGDYHFRFLVDGHELGRVSVSALEPFR